MTRKNHYPPLNTTDHPTVIHIEAFKIKLCMGSSRQSGPIRTIFRSGRSRAKSRQCTKLHQCVSTIAAFRLNKRNQHGQTNSDEFRKRFRIDLRHVAYLLDVAYMHSTLIAPCIRSKNTKILIKMWKIVSFRK